MPTRFALTPTDDTFLTTAAGQANRYVTKTIARGIARRAQPIAAEVRR
ncbi:hypothetical protein ACFXO9_06430 [Nocardia tengchongensis]